MPNRYSFDPNEHVHRLDGKVLYGTTTALSVIDKAGLTYWAAGLSCQQFGWINSKRDGNGYLIPYKDKEKIEARKKEVEEAAREGLSNIIMNFTPCLAGDIKEWVQFLDKAYRAHKTNLDKTAHQGVDLHFAVESYIKSKMTDGKIHLTTEQLEILFPFMTWCEKNVKKFIFSEVHCYSEALFCGGIVDLAYIDNENRLILGDVKSAKDIYFSNLAQLGGYHLQLEENGLFTTEGNLISVLDRPIQGHAIFHFGNGFTEPSISYQVERNKEAFKSALKLFQARESFEEEFEKDV